MQGRSSTQCRRLCRRAEQNNQLERQFRVKQRLLPCLFSRDACRHDVRRPDVRWRDGRGLDELSGPVWKTTG